MLRLNAKIVNIVSRHSKNGSRLHMSRLDERGQFVRITSCRQCDLESSCRNAGWSWQDCAHSSIWRTLQTALGMTWHRWVVDRGLRIRLEWCVRWHQGGGSVWSRRCEGRYLLTLGFSTSALLSCLGYWTKTHHFTEPHSWVLLPFT